MKIRGSAIKTKVFKSLISHSRRFTLQIYYGYKISKCLFLFIMSDIHGHIGNVEKVQEMFRRNQWAPQQQLSYGQGKKYFTASIILSIRALAMHTCRALDRSTIHQYGNNGRKTTCGSYCRSGSQGARESTLTGKFTKYHTYSISNQRKVSQTA